MRYCLRLGTRCSLSTPRPSNAACIRRLHRCFNVPGLRSRYRGRLNSSGVSPTCSDPSRSTNSPRPTPRSAVCRRRRSRTHGKDGRRCEVVLSPSSRNIPVFSNSIRTDVLVRPDTDSVKTSPQTIYIMTRKPCYRRENRAMPLEISIRIET